MKYIYYFSILIAFTCVSQQANAGDDEKPGFFRRTFAKLTWSEVQSVVETPREIARRVKTHVDYVDDDIDTLKSAEETWESAEGDCEDFANCVVELCRKKGINAWIEVIQEKGDINAHAVAMGTWKGKAWISSNGSFEYIKSRSEARRTIAREMGWDKTKVASLSWNEARRAGSGLMFAAKPTGIPGIK